MKSTPPTLYFALATRTGIVFCALSIHLLTMFLPAHTAEAQLRVRENIPLEELVRNYFIGGGASVNNIQYRGFPRAIGYFDGKNSNIGIDEGILLTTGWVGIAPGPNRYEDATFRAFYPGDLDLSNLVGAITYDACVLEFDFIPYQDTVSFEYVFASEEYEEYVGSPFNDVFAFFISGPGIQGKENIALIPGTTTPVAINNVNHLLNTQYYINNDGGLTVEYDGFTTVLKASSLVIPCETYRLKIAIADVSDDRLDSGVFLKSGSFNAGDVFEVRALRDVWDRGCRPGLFEIIRGGDLSKWLTSNFHLLGDAVNGSDYEFIQQTVTFEPGQSSVIIPVYAMNTDDNDEKMVILYIEDFCDTGLARDTLYIRKAEELTVSMPKDTVICDGEEIRLVAGIHGGSGVFLSRWTGGEENDSVLTVIPAASRFHYFSVLDTLTGCEILDSVYVFVEELPLADAGPDRVICPGDGVEIGTVAVGGMPPYEYHWSPAAGLSDASIATPIASPVFTMKYMLTVRSAHGCESYDSVIVYVTHLSLDAGPDTIICHGDIVRIGGEVANGTPPYSYQWHPIDGLSGSTVAEPLAYPDTSTMYYVAARDANGCEIVDSVFVEVSWIRANAGIDRMLCPGDSVRIGAPAEYSHSPVTYSWEPGTALDDRFSPTPMAKPSRTTSYIVTATNGKGCIDRDTVTIVVSDLSVDAGSDIAICPGESVPLVARATGGIAPYLFRWSPDSTLVSGDVYNPTATPDTSTWYIVTVTDANNCTVRDSVRVTVYPMPRVRIQPSGPTLLCTGDSVTLDAGASMASYAWSTGETTKSIRVGSAGAYWVAVTSLDGCPGISDTIEVRVTDRPAPVITGPTTVCEGDEVTFSVPDAGPALYQWSITGAFILSGNGTPEVRVRWDAPGAYTVAIEIVLGSASCRGDTLINVVVLPLPKPFITPAGPISFCQGDTVMLEAPSGFSEYEWSTGERSRSIIVRESGRYSVTVSSVDGCKGTSPDVGVFVFPLPEPSIRLLTPATVCEGDSIIAEVSEIYASQRWSTGETSRRIVLHADAMLWVSVQSADGCSGNSDTMAVRVIPLPQPEIIADGPLEFCEGDSVTLRTTQEFTSWFWSNGEETQSVIIRQSGVYSVRVRNEHGCEALSQELLVTVHPNPPDPPITRVEGELLTIEGYFYQWFIEDNGEYVAIPGAVNRSIEFEYERWYKVSISTAHGCTAMSLPFTVPVDFVSTTTIGLPVLNVAPGDEVIVPLSLLASEHLTDAGVSGFSATIRFEASALLPMPGTPAGRIVGGERVIDLDMTYDGESTTLADLRLRAALGLVESTPLILERFVWDNNAVIVTRIDGRVDVDVCEEGGVRLFDSAGRLRLAQNHPNPFNAMTTIEYETIEMAHTELYVLDMLGRRVATLVEGMLEPGAYRVSFNAGALASGMYIYVMHTPTGVLTRVMRLLK